MNSARWKPHLVLRMLLWWTSITFVTGWLPLIRSAFDGSSYEWATSYFGHDFSGKGLTGDYWLVIVKVILGLAILFLGWRGARNPFGYLLIGWQIFGFGDSVFSAVTKPEDFRFRGDTLGVDVSLAWVAPALYGVALSLSVWWYVKERKNRLTVDPGWSSANTRWMIMLSALLPVQFFLLRNGGPNTTMDQIGVLLTIVQWFLIPFALRLRPSSEPVAVST